MEWAIALIGLAGSIIGLIAALVSRHQVVIHRYGDSRSRDTDHKPPPPLLHQEGSTGQAHEPFGRVVVPSRSNKSLRPLPAGGKWVAMFLGMTAGGFLGLVIGFLVKEPGVAILGLIVGMLIGPVVWGAVCGYQEAMREGRQSP